MVDVSWCCYYVLNSVGRLSVLVPTVGWLVGDAELRWAAAPWVTPPSSLHTTNTPPATAHTARKYTEPISPCHSEVDERVSHVYSSLRCRSPLVSSCRHASPGPRWGEMMTALAHVFRSTSTNHTFSGQKEQKWPRKHVKTFSLARESADHRRSHHVAHSRT